MLPNLIRNHLTKFLIGFLFIAIASGFFLYQDIVKSNSQNQLLEEVELTFDPEGPYVVLTPRRDGNAVVLNIKRISSYDAFAYSLSYSDDQGIDRGAGDENTWIELKDKKSDYEQEILFGTCSKNICKYDKGVENGTLVLKIKKGYKSYRMLATWHLQKPDVALGNLVSGDGHFSYKTDANRQTLITVGFTIINDLTGAPKLPDGKKVLGKVYTLNAPLVKDIPRGKVEIELAENSPSNAQIARFDEGLNKWIEYDTKVEGSKLTAQADGVGIFAVLIPKK